MIVCKHCSTKNGLDSRFCLSCGLELSDEDRDRAQLELDKLVAEGYSLLGHSRTEEAALVAEKVLEDAPNFAEALSLLGMCHERNHDTLAALECYERVVELRPDSALDRIKVQQLRNALSREAKEGAKPNRAMAILGACAAVILMGSLGGIVATMIARPAAASTVATNDQATNSVASSFTNRERDLPKSAPTDTQTAPGPIDVPSVGNGNPNPNARIFTPIGRAPETLPKPVGDGETTDTGGPVRPVQPDFKGVDVVPTGNAGVRPDDPGPDNGANKGGSGTNVSTPPPTEDPGVIDIKKVGGGKPGLGGTEDIGHSEEGLTAILKFAREQFMLGKYGPAATAYEKALRAGGDSGSINQRLGQCYSRLGKNSEAIAAYTRAESALEASANAGHGGAKAALEAVRQALKNLRGE